MVINDRLLGTAVEVRPKTDSNESVVMIFQGLSETRSMYAAAICENKDGKIFFFPLEAIRFLDTEDVQTEIMHYAMAKIPEKYFNSNLINRDGIFDKNANKVKIVRGDKIDCGYKNYGIDETIAEYEFVAFDEYDTVYRCGDLYWEEKTDET